MVPEGAAELERDQMPIEEGAFPAQPTRAPETGTEAAAYRRRGIGYIRVASIPQAAPRPAVDAQIARVQAIADAGAVELSGIVDDSGTSGLDMSRPGLLRVLAAVAEGRIDVVIVEDLIRLARDPEDLQGFLDSFTSRGVTVIHGDM